MHGQRTWVVVALVALLALTPALAGCWGAKKASDSGTVTTSERVRGENGGGSSAEESAGVALRIVDDASRTVTLEKPARRIVTLAPGNTEILYALGLMDQVVGVTTYDDYPEQVKSLPKMGDFMNPNVEAIAAAKPDLVLMTSGVQAATIAQLEKLGAKVVVIDPATIEELYGSIVNVGKLTNTRTKADEVVREMKRKLASVEQKLAGGKRVTVFVEIAQNPVYTTGPGTLLADVVTRAGGDIVVKEPGYVGYSLEQLLKDDPEFYLATKGSMNDPLDVTKRPGYDKLRAVRAKHVYALTDNLVSRPGPRIVDGVEQVARFIHPGAFK